MVDCGHVKARIQRNLFSKALKHLWSIEAGTESAVYQ